MPQVIVDGVEYHLPKEVREPKNQIPPRGHVSMLHIRTAKDWKDAIECLEWAAESNATPAEMRAWHKAFSGLDLLPDVE